MTWVRADNSPPRSPEVIELLMDVPFEVEVEISSCEALN